MAVFLPVHYLHRPRGPDPDAYIALPPKPSTTNMPRRQRSRTDEYDSDGSFLPEDHIFDVDEEAFDAESEVTQIDPLDLDGSRKFL